MVTLNRENSEYDEKNRGFEYYTKPVSMKYQR